jgi:division/cell wall cluster transcriptional repressor MraZ
MLFDIKFADNLATIPLDLQGAFLPLMTDKSFTATANLERSISLYKQSDWVTLELAIKRLPNCHHMVRRIQRLLLAHAAIVNQSADGQILFPTQLLDYACINTSAVAIVYDHKLEIWNRRILEKYFNMTGRNDRIYMANLCKNAEKKTTGLFSHYLCPNVKAALSK